MGFLRAWIARLSETVSVLVQVDAETGRRYLFYNILRLLFVWGWWFLSFFKYPLIRWTVIGGICFVMGAGLSFGVLSYLNSGPDLTSEAPVPDTSGFDAVISGDDPALDKPVNRERYPQNFYLVSDFDARSWGPLPSPDYATGEVKRVTDWPNIGELALHLSVHDARVAEDATGELRFQTGIRLRQPLHLSEDWTLVEHVSLEVNLQEFLHTIPELDFCLINSNEGRACFSTAGTGGVQPWGDIVSFPLEQAALSEPLTSDQLSTILVDVVMLEIILDLSVDETWAEQFNEDNRFDIYFSRLMIDGHAVWDEMMGQQFEWGPERAGGGVSAGISHVRTYQDSAGSLHLAWQPSLNQYEKTERPVGMKPSRPAVVALNWPEIADQQQTNWSEIGYLEAFVWTDAENLPLEFELWDGESSLRTVTSQVSQSGSWSRVIWKIPARQPGFRYEQVQGIKLVMPDQLRYPKGELWLDELRFGRSIYIPHAVEVDTHYLYNTIRWKQPAFEGIDQVHVVASRTDFPLSPIDGELVCSTSITAPGRCLHTGLSRNELWYYTLFSQDRYAYRTADLTSQAVGSQALYRFRPPNAAYEAGFHLETGNLLYLVDLATGQLLMSGDPDQPLWRLELFPTDLSQDLSKISSLHSSLFSSDPQRDYYLEIDEGQNRFTYRVQPESGETIELTLTLRPSASKGIQFEAELQNQSGHVVRNFSFPGLISFDDQAVEQVYLPLSEGVALQPSFFEEGRRGRFQRPGDFMADFTAVELPGETIGLFFAPPSRSTVNLQGLVPSHPAGDAVLQPSQWLIDGGKGDAENRIGLHFPIFIPPGQTWRAPNVYLTFEPNVETILDRYLAETTTGQTRPSLSDKLTDLNLDLAEFGSLPLYRLDLAPWVSQSDLPEGEAWETLNRRLADQVPGPAILNLSHWQYGRDWYRDPEQNHLRDDNLPARLPIWWGRYGEQRQFYALLDQLEARGTLTAPAINPLVWNGYDPQTRDVIDAKNSAVGLSGANLSVYEAKRGILVEPWNRTVQSVHNELLETFEVEVPQDLLFIEEVSRSPWRYVSLGESGLVSWQAYSQGWINEVARLSTAKPLILDSMHDRFTPHVLGMSDSVWASVTDRSFQPLGAPYVNWVPYPIAASILQGEVALIAPNLDPSTATDWGEMSHYLQFGYGLSVDLLPYLNEPSSTLSALEVAYRFQNSVAAHTIGAELEAFDRLTMGRPVYRALWRQEKENENEIHEIEIVANHAKEMVYNLDGYGIAPSGFMARATQEGDLSGLFVERFNGVPLSAGLHALAVEMIDGRRLHIYHPLGDETFIEIDRPEEWDENEEILIAYKLINGRTVAGRPVSLSLDRITINLINRYEGVAVDYVSIGYGLDPDPLYELFSPPVLAPLTPIVIGESGTLPTTEPHAGNDEREALAVVELLPAADELAAAPIVNQLPQLDAQPAYVSDPITYTQAFTFDSDITTYGWVSSIGEVTILPDRRVSLTEMFETGAYSRMETRPFEIEMRPDLEIDIWVTNLSPGASYTLQIQEDQAPYQTFDLLQSNRPDRVAINLQGVTGWRGTRRFRFIAWVSGEEGQVELGRMSIRARPTEDNRNVDDLALAEERASVVPVLWEERFGPLDHIWQPTDLVTTLQTDGTMGLTPSSQGFGKLESDIIKADVTIYPTLLLNVVAVDAGGRYVVQLLEEGGLYRSYDLYEGEQLGEQSFDLSEVTDWEGEKTFRLLLWVVGESRKISIDSVKIQAKTE